MTTDKFKTWLPSHNPHEEFQKERCETNAETFLVKERQKFNNHWEPDYGNDTIISITPSKYLKKGLIYSNK